MSQDHTTAFAAAVWADIATADAYRAEKIAEAERERDRAQSAAAYWRELSPTDVLTEIRREKERAESAEERRQWKADEAQDEASRRLGKVWWRGCVCGLVAAYPLWWLFWRLAALYR